MKQTEQKLLFETFINLSLPVVILDRNLDIRWANQTFSTLAEGQVLSGSELLEYFPDELKATFNFNLKVRETIRKSCVLWDKATYDVVVDRQVLSDQSVLFLCLFSPVNIDKITLRAIGQVSSQFGHDFNNFLGAIRGATDLIKHKASKHFESENPFLRPLQLIDRAVDKALNMTTRMRGFLRFETGHREILNIQKLVESVVDTLKGSSPDLCEFVLDFRSNAEIEASEFQLAQAFQSILLNAIDGMEQLSSRCLAIIIDRRELSTPFRTLSIGSYVEIVIIDHGKGLTESTLSKGANLVIGQVSPINSDLSLGLLMAKEILLEHRGLLEVHSVPEVGSSVRVLLPVKSESKIA